MTIVEKGENMKLIVATNRSPYSIKKEKNHITLQRGAGGLISALDPVMKKNAGVWVCESDILLNDYDIKLPYPIKQIKLTENETKHYYDGFCNTQIWPIFHYFPAKYKFHIKDWGFYKQVNQKFADEIAAIVESDDIIWVHDYQLMLLPKLLRNMGIKNKIGFFLHIPFPNFEVYRIFPKRIEILEALLSCDLIGFHTQSYQKHFIESVKYFFGSQAGIKENLIQYKDNLSKVVALPISIDYKHIETAAKSLKVENKLLKLKDNFNNQIIGLGVDRLDYSKGIIEKFEGLELFFEKKPEYIKKVSFIQIAVPTRVNVTEYRKLKRQTDEAVGRINGKFSRDGWSPIHYIYSNVTFEDLIAYYRLADFIIVSALRDGLNLVAKEYVSSRINNSGTLILSEFTGASEEMPYRYSINPYDSVSISSAIEATLKGNEVKKSSEMSNLRNYVKENDIFKWFNNFLTELKQ
jgi:alpha,alpha-trehalose-phosphate synthase [UDP-forming]